MREIKFRAKSRQTNEWWYSDYSDNGNGDADFWYGIEDGQYDSETLGQYTGLKDKHGKEIYESDILSYDGKAPIGYVRYCDKEFLYWVCYEHYNIHFTLADVVSQGNFEVIGNIYENPELLEVSK